jgi:hypothetical protein
VAAAWIAMAAAAAWITMAVAAADWIIIIVAVAGAWIKRVVVAENMYGMFVLAKLLAAGWETKMLLCLRAVPLTLKKLNPKKAKRV